MTQKDKTIVRDLAKRYMELALSEEQQRMNRRMKDTNDLKITRPPVLLDEIPWYQMNIDDTLFEPFWRVTRSSSSSRISPPSPTAPKTSSRGQRP